MEAYYQAVTTSACEQYVIVLLARFLLVCLEHVVILTQKVHISFQSKFKNQRTIVQMIYSSFALILRISNSFVVYKIAV